MRVHAPSAPRPTRCSNLSSYFSTSGPSAPCMWKQTRRTFCLSPQFGEPELEGVDVYTHGMKFGADSHSSESPAARPLDSNQAGLPPASPFWSVVLPIASSGRNSRHTDD